MREKEFLNLYAEAAFRHREELIDGLREEIWEFSSFTGGPKNKVKGESLLKAYGRKAEDPTIPVEQGFGELRTALEKFLQSIIDVWSFVGPDHYINVFIAQETGEVLASVKTPADA